MMTGNSTARWFELAVQQRHNGRELVLWQWERRVENGRTSRRPRRQRVGVLAGRSLAVAEEDVRSLLGRNGVKELERHGRVQLTEPLGARLGVLFLTLRPLRRVERMVRLIEGVRRLADEEAYYWYAQCTVPGRAARGRRALRILLSGD